MKEIRKFLKSHGFKAEKREEVLDFDGADDPWENPDMLYYFHRNDGADSISVTFSWGEPYIDAYLGRNKFSLRQEFRDEEDIIAKLKGIL